MTTRRASGFTLIELMIVVAVVAILATIALPSYQAQMRKSRRSEAISALQDVQLRAERWRVDHKDWADFSASFPTSAHYTFEFSSTSGSAYSITATATGNQANDICGNLTLASNNTDISKTSSKGSNCW